MVLHNLHIVRRMGGGEGGGATSQMDKSLELIVCNCKDEW